MRKVEYSTLFLYNISGDCMNIIVKCFKHFHLVNKHRLGKASLKDEYLIAGDVNKDGKVDIRDILQINKYRLNKINLL